MELLAQEVEEKNVFPVFFSASYFTRQGSSMYFYVNLCVHPKNTREYLRQ